MKLPISFPNQAEQLRHELEAFAGATAEERLQAVADTLAAADALSAAGGRREDQLRYHDWCEREWRNRMREFIAQHVAVAARAVQ